MTALIDGPVGSRLLRFVLPILGGNILQQLYISIDAMIIGRFVGDDRRKPTHHQCRAGTGNRPGNR